MHGCIEAACFVLLPGCAVLAAVAAGKIAPERHESYSRLYALSAQVCDWEKKK